MRRGAAPAGWCLIAGGGDPRPQLAPDLPGPRSPPSCPPSGAGRSDHPPSRLACDALRRLALPRDALPCDALPCDALPCDALPCDALPCDALPCDACPATHQHRDALGASRATRDGVVLDHRNGGSTTPPHRDRTPTPQPVPPPQHRYRPDDDGADPSRPPRGPSTKVPTHDAGADPLRRGRPTTTVPTHDGARPPRRPQPRHRPATPPFRARTPTAQPAPPPRRRCRPHDDGADPATTAPGCACRPGLVTATRREPRRGPASRLLPRTARSRLPPAGRDGPAHPEAAASATTAARIAARAPGSATSPSPPIIAPVTGTGTHAASTSAACA